MNLSLAPASVIITTVLYLSDALRKNFLSDKFDYKVETGHTHAHT